MRFPLISILLLATTLPALAHEHREAYQRRAFYQEAAPRCREERRAPWVHEWREARCDERREDYRADYRDECRDEYRHDRHWRNRSEGVVLDPGPGLLLPPPLPLPHLRIRLSF